MSLHPSLKVDSAGSAQRNVLTRIERIKDLMKKDLWSDKNAVVALPKTKIIKIKSKKTTKTKEEGVATEGAAATSAADAKSPAAKAPAAKAEAKK